jgi:hypothetical protein
MATNLDGPFRANSKAPGSASCLDVALLSFAANALLWVLVAIYLAAPVAILGIVAAAITDYALRDEAWGGRRG